MMNNLTVRYMRPGDIAQVAAIDQQSFDPPWSVRSYAYEIGESSYSHMVVLARPGSKAGIWQRLFHRAAPDEVLAYGGLWCIEDEGHISTIASHPDFRGCGYGEIVLAAMIQRAITLGAAYIVLEVRVSNTVAQKLYKKYGFAIAETKANYYRSDNEDAYEMHLNLDDTVLRQRFEALYAAARTRHGFSDSYSAGKATRT
jgi:ribosomal-protein-alanine N-acetyltransferase